VTARVALVTAAVARELDEDLPLLVDALARRGIEADVAVWDDPDVDWGSYALAVVRSTWDYTPRRDEFLAWAYRVAAVTALANPPPVLAWSTDKRYLADLAAAGVPVVPTQWLEPETAPRPLPAPEAAGASEIVVKPVVGAGTVGAGRFEATAAGRAAADEHAACLLAEGMAVMVQPYLDAIDEAGETALVYVAGVTKAAILRPGGTAFIDGGLYAEEDLEPGLATPAQRAVGEAALAAIARYVSLDPARTPLLYARVDLVPGTDGSPVVLELELAEPSLFLSYADGAADRVAAAIAARVSPPSR
jgi:hypothetical protein